MGRTTCEYDREYLLYPDGYREYPDIDRRQR